MTARYALRFENADGTLDEPYHYVARKREALLFARQHARRCSLDDIVRIWVDDTTTDLGVASFETARPSRA